jgi:hypothetical protein
VGIARFAEHGVGVQTCLFGLDGSDDVAAVVAAALRTRPWECVVIGGGVRNKDQDQLELFEQILNLVRRYAPDAAIAFNSTPAAPPALASLVSRLPTADAPARPGQSPRYARPPGTHATRPQ